MSTSKLKLNPDKTKFIIFGLKVQRDRLKACFPINILGSENLIQHTILKGVFLVAQNLLK